MKANRKFLNNDEGVSPVIAVILMVAITVVLAATVYVWVSGFGQSGSQAKNLSVTQTGTLITADNSASCSSLVATEDGCVKFTVVSISSNFAGNNLRVTDSTTSTGTITCEVNGAAVGATALAAGDTLMCYWSNDVDAASGDAFNFIDIASNTVVATITIHS